jgi:hypothetical protein
VLLSGCYRFIEFEMSDDVIKSVNEKYNKINKQIKRL